MKLKKLLMCFLAATVVCGMSSVNARAAENDIAVSVATDATKEESENNAVDDEKAIAIEPTLEDEKEDSTQEVQEEEKEDKEQEEKAEEKKEEKKQSSPKTSYASKKTTTKAKQASTGASYTKAELRLLSCLIYCESGNQPYAGKLAVGIVVMNRKQSSQFPNSISKVIYQKSQFGPARNGSLSKALAKYDNGSFNSSNEKDCVKAAKAALGGTKTVTYKGKELNLKGFLYFSGKVSGAKLTIGGHQFK